MGDGFSVGATVAAARTSTRGPSLSAVAPWAMGDRWSAWLSGLTLEVDCMVDFIVEFIADFIAGVLELAAEPWFDRLKRKWKTGKRCKQRSLPNDGTD